MKVGIHWIVSVSILLCNISQVQLQSCNSRMNIRRIYLLPVPFMGTLAIFPDGITCLRQEAMFIYCESPNVLTDGIAGPEHPDLFMYSDIHRLLFVVWIKESTSPFISIIPTNTAATISAIDLYVYNYPAKQFSLPNLELYGTSNANVYTPPPESALEFDLLNNALLSQNDINILRKITLRLRMPTTVTALLLRWNFTGVFNTEFFGISELILHCQEEYYPEYYTQTISFLAPEIEMTTIVPKSNFLNTKSLALTCTVAVQGSFEWHWRKGSENIVESPTNLLFTADGSRTSILNISQLNFADDGLYICEARFSIETDTYSRFFKISFPQLIEGSPSIKAHKDNGSITISCEVYGYFTKSIIEPIWMKKDCGRYLINSSKYSITSLVGQNEQIFSNRDTALSYISLLSIMKFSNNDVGMYTCIINGLQFITEISLMENTANGPKANLVPTGQTITSPNRNSTSSFTATYVPGAGKEIFLMVPCILALLCYC